MKTLILASLALTTAPLAAIASQDSARDRVDAVVRCLEVSDPQQRLACFDAAASALRRGVQSGAVAVEEGSGRPRFEFPMRAAVTSSRSNDAGRWLVTLDNSQVWETEDRQISSERPRSGATLQIERGFLGTGYWLRLPNGNRYRVRLIG